MYVYMNRAHEELVACKKGVGIYGLGAAYTLPLSLQETRGPPWVSQGTTHPHPQAIKHRFDWVTFLILKRFDLCWAWFVFRAG